MAARAGTLSQLSLLVVEANEDGPGALTLSLYRRVVNVATPDAVIGVLPRLESDAVIADNPRVAEHVSTWRHASVQSQAVVAIMRLAGPASTRDPRLRHPVFSSQAVTSASLYTSPSP